MGLGKRIISTGCSMECSRRWKCGQVIKLHELIVDLILFLLRALRDDPRDGARHCRGAVELQDTDPLIPFQHIELVLSSGKGGVRRSEAEPQ